MLHSQHLYIVESISAIKGRGESRVVFESVPAFPEWPDDGDHNGVLSEMLRKNEKTLDTFLLFTAWIWQTRDDATTSGV